MLLGNGGESRRYYLIEGIRVPLRGPTLVYCEVHKALDPTLLPPRFYTRARR